MNASAGASIMNHQDIERARAVATGIIQRASEDAGFRDQLRADPRSTLLAEGLPEEMVDDLISNGREWAPMFPDTSRANPAW
jgi:hypothetical protein